MQYSLDVKEAVQTAKDYLTDLFADEDITDVGLEEVEFDEFDNAWKVTVGFSRPWDHENILSNTLDGNGHPNRSYKVVQVNDHDGVATSVTDRILKFSN